MGRVDALSRVARVKTTAGARMRIFENRAHARMTKMKFHFGDAVGGTHLPNGGVIRALFCAGLCEIFATL